MSVFIDICILIFLAIPFIIYNITVIIFCHEYLNVINDVLVYYKENKKSIVDINSLGGPGGIGALEHLKGYLKYMIGISIFILIMVFVFIGLLYFKKFGSLFKNDNTTLSGTAKNTGSYIISSIIICCIFLNLLSTNIVCGIFLTGVSENEKYSETLKSKIRKVKELAKFTISWTWLQFIAYLIIYFVLYKFVRKRLDNIFPDMKHDIAYWDQMDKERGSHAFNV